MKAVKGCRPRRTRVFPALSIKIKKPKRAPLPLVRVKETKEIGFLLKRTDKFIIVFLQSGRRKKFHPHEVEKIKIKEEVRHGKMGAY